MLNKRLGQHFLTNKQIVADIIRAGDVSKKDIVLEVGPGKGVLTEALAKKAKRVITVEKDRELVSYLKDKFKNQKNVEIIYGDILTSPFAPLLRKERGYKIIANIPYYITSHFLRMFLSGRNNSHPQPPPSYGKREGARGRVLLPKPSLVVLMIQKEVAERIVARDGHESLLSLSVKAYGKPEIVKIVRKGNFLPPPKVDSAIIKISDISDKWFVKHSMIAKKFFEILRKAFQQKRKMLRHSLGKNIPEKYQNKRPEELGLEEWKKIINP